MERWQVVFFAKFFAAILVIDGLALLAAHLLGVT